MIPCWTKTPNRAGGQPSARAQSLPRVEIDGVHYAATGSNPIRARESLGMILRAHEIDPTGSGDAETVDAPDVGPWSFRWSGGPYVDVSRPGAVDVDVVEQYVVCCRRWTNFQVLLRIAVGATNSPKPPPERVSLTYGALNRARWCGSWPAASRRLPPSPQPSLPRATCTTSPPAASPAPRRRSGSSTRRPRRL